MKESAEEKTELEADFDNRSFCWSTECFFVM